MLLAAVLAISAATDAALSSSAGLSNGSKCCSTHGSICSSTSSLAGADAAPCASGSEIELRYQVGKYINQTRAIQEIEAMQP